MGIDIRSVLNLLTSSFCAFWPARDSSHLEHVTDWIRSSHKTLAISCARWERLALELERERYLFSMKILYVRTSEGNNKRTHGCISCVGVCVFQSDFIRSSSRRPPARSAARVCRWCPAAAPRPPDRTWWAGWAPSASIRSRIPSWKASKECSVVGFFSVKNKIAQLRQGWTRLQQTNLLYVGTRVHIGLW